MGKKLLRKPLAQREAQLIKRMKTVGKLKVTTIATIAQRDKKSIYKVLSGGNKFAKRGPKEKLKPRDVTHLVRTLKAMCAKAKARWEVTLAMLKKRAKIKVDDKVVRKALQSRNIKFRRMRGKPILTKADRKARYAFAKKWKSKSAAWWVKALQEAPLLHWDLKNFPVYPHAKARDIAAMREVRGAYRAPSQGLDEAYVVLPKDLRYNPGAKSCRIAAAVGGGKVRLWHEVGSRWSGKVAADLYAGPLSRCFKSGWPKKKTWKLLEDNDPTGFKSKKAEKAKKAAKIKIFTIPKRSPDLNICDYWLWKEVTRTMRRQERRFHRSRRETRW